MAAAAFVSSQTGSGSTISSITVGQPSGSAGERVVACIAVEKLFPIGTSVVDIDDTWTFSAGWSLVYAGSSVGEWDVTNDIHLMFVVITSVHTGTPNNATVTTGIADGDSGYYAVSLKLTESSSVNAPVPSAGQFVSPSPTPPPGTYAVSPSTPGSITTTQDALLVNFIGSSNGDLSIPNSASSLEAQAPIWDELGNAGGGPTHIPRLSFAAEQFPADTTALPVWKSIASTDGKTLLWWNVGLAFASIDSAAPFQVLVF